MTMPLLDTLDPLLAECTDDQDGRYTLTKPWIRNGFVYATDGRILVRQATKQADTTDDKPPGGAEHMFDESKPRGKSIPLPDIGMELGDRLVCEKCKGKNSSKTCSECNGEGSHVCPTCSHAKPCRACEGEGDKYCSACGGEGMLARKRTSVKLRPRHTIGLADYYVWLLRRHGIDAVRMTTTATSFYFSKGKIRGIVMGCALGSDDDAYATRRDRTRRDMTRHDETGRDRT